MNEFVLPHGFNSVSEEVLFSVEGGNFLHVLGIATCVAAIAIVVVPVIVNPEVAIPALASGGWKGPAALFAAGVATYLTA